MKVAAFFDIDGTLLPPPSLESQFRGFLRWRGELGARQQWRWLGGLLTDVWRDPLLATHGNKVLYAGVRLTAMEAWLAFLRRHSSAGQSPLQFFPQALERLAWHAAEDHTLVLVSGTLRPLAEVAVEMLRARLSTLTDVPIHLEVLAAELETQGGRFTGRLTEPAVCGAQKGLAIEAFAAAHGLDLGASFAYGNSCLDRWMLFRVGHPAAVNPSFLLAQLARRRDWPVLRWTHTTSGRTEPAACARGLSAASTLQTNPVSTLPENPR